MSNIFFLLQAATTVGTNLIATVKATECNSNQSPTTIPSGGGIFKFTANSLPQEESKKQSSDSSKWIIVGSVLGFVILVALAIFLIYCCCCWWPRNKRNRRIRTKHQLWKFEHPMAEASMSIDAPSSMMPVFDPYESIAELASTNKDQNPNETFAGTFNPLRESSMILNLKEEARRARIRVKNKNFRSDSHLANGGTFGPRGAILAHLEAGSVLGSSLEDTMLSDRLFSSPSNSIVNSTPGLSAIAMQIPEQIPEQVPEQILEPPPVNAQDLRGEIPQKNAIDKRSFFEYRPKSKTTLEPKKNQVTAAEAEHLNHMLLSANSGQKKVGKTSTPRGKGSASIPSQKKSPMDAINESNNMPRTSTRNSFRQSELNMSRASSTVGREKLRRSTKDDPINAKGSELSAASSFSETDNINERKSSVVSAGSKLSNYFSKSMARLTTKRVRLNRLDVT
ncbi:hypothetical protein ACJMK2_039740 [Sinanodonta woodiana]|uniref:Uncharacterized protein n=1 Tax=Sinanodonta woodiana TaxID=1069815 RepID=A0ABD3WGD2_SINWO